MITEQLSHDELSKKRQEEQQDDFKIHDVSSGRLQGDFNSKNSELRIVERKTS